ncbi:DUF4235 domain-containing protein [Fulvivirga ligni]|uniref:DUF4235 domain-containing protein n=1 Tax=Fulvivirga ligni TaxID=2904246 RepID=UPI001F457008|nr:DUF4235 domain-containing protein [Fulvivirga ligni]UII24116.1 DUF4235 domain-containing protein [Fulvivirga ligni]
MNKKRKKQILSNIVFPGIAIASSFALRRLFDYGYQKVRKEDPPKTIRQNSYDTAHVIIWTVATSAIAGLGKLLAEDIVEKKWKLD